MSVLLDEAPATLAEYGRARPLQAGFPPRPVPDSWTATRGTRKEILDGLGVMPLVGIGADCYSQRLVGMRLLMDWLLEQPGRTWQERWLSSGAEGAGRDWRQVPAGWLRERGHGPWRRDCLQQAVPVAIAAEVFRPALTWLVGGGLSRGGRLVRNLSASRDPQGFARLRQVCEADDGVSGPLTTQVAYRCALILAAKGGVLAQVTVGDVVELFAVEDQVLTNPSAGRTVLYRVLRDLGIFGAEAPAMLRGLRTAGQRTPEQLIDRYHLRCAPVRDLLVDYLRERQPALDYTSLDSLSYHLGMRFWADIEAHHPGIESLRLPREVAEGWKRRLRTITKTMTSAASEKTQVSVPRINYRECLTPVRALYLDLAHWAVEDPARWGPWVAPCPIGEEEINRRKDKRHRKSRMDARTRERLPSLPALAASLAERRTSTLALLHAARDTRPGQSFTIEGTTLSRPIISRGTIEKVWAEDPATGKRRDLSREEDHAFWAWAIVEVLRATGIRVEELLELSHHALVQYRLPVSGELVPLLQILPSKTDAERLLVVSPELSPTSLPR